MYGPSLGPVPETPLEVQRAWGKVIRLERVERGERQVDVAARVPTDQKVVSKVERGEATLDATVRVAAALGLTVDDLTSRTKKTVA